VTYSVELEPAAFRQLKRVPRANQPRVTEQINSLADEPRPAGCEKLTDMNNAWRIRVGDYRVVYVVDDQQQIVVVTRIGHRRDVYRSR